jgi:hypothetical protein
MRVTRWVYPLVVLVLLAGAGPYAAAQDKLPTKLSGKWNGTLPGKGTPFGGNWSVVIDSQEPDGSITGKVNWMGAPYCTMDNEPFTGKFDGTQLTIVTQFRDKVANAQCGKAHMILKKKAAGYEFEGGMPASRNKYTMTLTPS